MNPSRTQLDSLLAEKRAEWSALLLQHNPRLQQPLQNALQILAKRKVTPLDSCNTFRVHGNPHNYTVNLAARECSCGKTNCEHFFAAWFAFSQDEIVRQEIERAESIQLSEPAHGIWRGPNEHVCSDDYHETTTFGFGDSTRCARCDELYSTGRDESFQGE